MRVIQLHSLTLFESIVISAELLVRPDTALGTCREADDSQGRTATAEAVDVVGYTTCCKPGSFG